MSLVFVEVTDIVRQVLKEALDDGTMEVSSSVARASKKVATDILAWSVNKENETALQTFATSLVAYLDLPLASSGGASKPQAVREKMWGTYHSVRTSPSFQELWTSFLKDAVKTEVMPILFQTLSDKVFQKRIESHFSIVEASESAGRVFVDV